MQSELHTILFPHVLFPLHQIAISGSIFMTVAIAWERYIATHHPLDYNQAMNDRHAIRKRLVKYVGTVLLLAIVFNVNKVYTVYFQVAQYCIISKAILPYAKSNVVHTFGGNFECGLQ